MKWGRRKIKVLLVLILLIVGICEGAARLYWVVRHDLPFFGMEGIDRLFYKELNTVPVLQDYKYNVLILGGSVVSPEWLADIQSLEERLPEVVGQPVIVVNLARAGHSTLDTWVKYEAIGHQGFDAIFIYHGINDLRANNCPPDVFRDDYSHMVWYEQVNLCVAYPWKAWCVFPFTLHYSSVILDNKVRTTAKLPSSGFPTTGPMASWIQYGSDVKSHVPFKERLEKIIVGAKDRGQKVVLATFKIHIPDGYSSEKFKRRELDYADYKCPLETWGTPENVAAGIQVHNQILRQLALQHSHVHLIDMEVLIPSRGEYFVDVCHLSPAGQELFLKLLVENWPPETTVTSTKKTP